MFLRYGYSLKNGFVSYRGAIALSLPVRGQSKHGAALSRSEQESPVSRRVSCPRMNTGVDSQIMARMRTAEQVIAKVLQGQKMLDDGHPPIQVAKKLQVIEAA